MQIIQQLGIIASQLAITGVLLTKLAINYAKLKLA